MKAVPAMPLIGRGQPASSDPSALNTWIFGAAPRSLTMNSWPGSPSRLAIVTADSSSSVPAAKLLNWPRVTAWPSPSRTSVPSSCQA